MSGRIAGGYGGYVLVLEVCSGTTSIVWPPRASIWGSVGDDNTRTIAAGQAATHIYATHMWAGSATHDSSISSDGL